MSRTVHYYRVQPREDNELVASTGKLAGGPPRNIFQSAFPKVKAFIGKLGEQTGIEFITMVQPDKGCPPARHTGRRDTRVWKCSKAVSWLRLQLLLSRGTTDAPRSRRCNSEPAGSRLDRTRSRRYAAASDSDHPREARSLYGARTV